MNKHLIICADDYGQNDTISEGILQLATMRRINAVSCMANIPFWPDAAQALLSHPTCYTGLHLNLTHGKALSSSWRKLRGAHFYKLPQLLRDVYFKRITVDLIVTEIQAQLEAFVQTMNAYPDFIDGHQHIHQLPIIRDALLIVCDEIKQKTADASRFFVRNTCNSWQDMLSINGFPKRQLITLLGGVSFSRALNRQQMVCNSSFSGIYNFKKAVNYRHYFKQFLKHSRNGGLIMCHPGLPSVDKTDPLSPYRLHELNYFLSDDYLCDLAERGFQLSCKESL